MKFLTLFITAIILLFSFSSCGKKDNSSVESDTVSTGLSEASNDSLENVEGDSDEIQPEDITEQANEIINGLTPALATADSILSRQNIKFDAKTIEAQNSNGVTETYYKYPAPYDTVDACMEAMHECYTDKMCENIYSMFFDMQSDNSWSVFYVTDDGLIYVPDGEVYHIRFTMPITSAEKTADDIITAKTSIIQQDGSDDFEIVLKKEGDTWKVDSFATPNQEGTTPYATPDES